MAHVTGSDALQENRDSAQQFCSPSTLNISGSISRAPRFAMQKRLDNGDCRLDRFESLCSRRRESLLRYVTWLSSDTDAAQDIVQTVLIRAWRSLHTLADDRAVTAWLHTIARREVARFYARKRLEMEDIGALSRVDEMFLSHEDTMALEDLQVSLNSMTDADQHILYEAMCGHTSEEIAASTGCSLPQARVRLFRARRRLFAMVAGSAQ